MLRTLLLLSLSMLLPSCGDPAGSARTSCAGWRPIAASAKDTEATLRQVLAHDETGRRLGCW